MGNQQSQSELCEIEPIIDYLDWIPSYTDFSIKHIPDNYFKEEEREYIDLRNKVSEIFDRDDNHLQIIKSFSIVFQHELYNENISIIVPSLSYILYYLRNIYKQNCYSYQYLFNVIKKYGVCSEKNFPSNLENIKNGVPDTSHYLVSQIYKHLFYYKLDNNVIKIKQILCNQKLVLIGVPVYSQFLKTRTDIKLELPDLNSDYIGGLSGVITGYNDKKQVCIVQIHQGRFWGNEGYIEIPYQYIEGNFGVELWIIDINKKMVDIQNQTIQSMQHIENNQTNVKMTKNQPKLEFHPFGV